MNDGPIIDRERLLRIRELQSPGEADVLDQIINMFLEDSSVRLARARDALARGDAAVMHREAHSLRGSAGLIGAIRVAQAAGPVEDSAAAGDLSAVPPLLDALARAVDEAFAALAAFKSSGA